ERQHPRICYLFLVCPVEACICERSISAPLDGAEVTAEVCGEFPLRLFRSCGLWRGGGQGRRAGLRKKSCYGLAPGTLSEISYSAGTEAWGTRLHSPKPLEHQQGHSQDGVKAGSN